MCGGLSRWLCPAAAADRTARRAAVPAEPIDIAGAAYSIGLAQAEFNRPIILFS